MHERQDELSRDYGVLLSKVDNTLGLENALLLSELKNNFFIIFGENLELANINKKNSNSDENYFLTSVLLDINELLNKNENPEEKENLTKKIIIFFKTKLTLKEINFNGHTIQDPNIFDLYMIRTFNRYDRNHELVEKGLQFELEKQQLSSLVSLMKKIMKEENYTDFIFDMKSMKHFSYSLETNWFLLLKESGKLGESIISIDVTSRSQIKQILFKILNNDSRDIYFPDIYKFFDKYFITPENISIIEELDDEYVEKFLRKLNKEEKNHNLFFSTITKDQKYAKIVDRIGKISRLRTFYENVDYGYLKYGLKYLPFFIDKFTDEEVKKLMVDALTKSDQIYDYYNYDHSYYYDIESIFRHRLYVPSNDNFDNQRKIILNRITAMPRYEVFDLFIEHGFKYLSFVIDVFTDEDIDYLLGKMKTKNSIFEDIISEKNLSPILDKIKQLDHKKIFEICLTYGFYYLNVFIEKKDIDKLLLSFELSEIAKIADSAFSGFSNFSVGEKLYILNIFDIKESDQAYREMMLQKMLKYKIFFYAIDQLTTKESSLIKSILKILSPTYNLKKIISDENIDIIPFFVISDNEHTKAILLLKAFHDYYGDEFLSTIFSRISKNTKYKRYFAIALNTLWSEKLPLLLSFELT